MPSIPQSLLWISLVVLWLFVLVPMLISKRDAVRRTSDVALATRVLNTGRSSTAAAARRPAAGHRSDPDWQPSEDEVDDDVDDELPRRVDGSGRWCARRRRGRDRQRARIPRRRRRRRGLRRIAGRRVGRASRRGTERARPDQTDELPLDFERAGRDAEADEPEDALNPSATAPTTSTSTSTTPRAWKRRRHRPAAGRVDDAARRRRYESKTAAAVSARKYKFRKRMLTLMAVALVASAAAAFTWRRWPWWVCGAIGAVTVLYLAYLRRQTRIEERLRRRRTQRVARSRLGVENTDDREFDVVPSRLRRPGSVVLEIDDEDPIFEHLDYAPVRPRLRPAPRGRPIDRSVSAAAPRLVALLPVPGAMAQLVARLVRIE